MAEISRDYIEQRFKGVESEIRGVNRRLDEVLAAQERAAKDLREDKAGIYRQMHQNTNDVGQLKKEIEATKAAHPTYREVIAAIVIGAGIIISLVELVDKLF